MANEIWQFSRIIIDDLLRANASIATQLQKACDEPCQLGNPPPVRHAASACASSAPRALANSLTAAALSSPVEHYLKPPELHRGAGYSMSLDGDERFLDLADACKAIPMTAADLIALHRRLPFGQASSSCTPTGRSSKTTAVSPRHLLGMRHRRRGWRCGMSVGKTWSAHVGDRRTGYQAAALDASAASL